MQQEHVGTRSGSEASEGHAAASAQQSPVHVASNKPEPASAQDTEAASMPPVVVKPPKSSQYRGVGWNKANRRWRAAIKSGSGRYLWYYDTEIEAARVFDKAAVRLRGPRATLNFRYTDYVDDAGVVLPDAAVEALMQKATKTVKPRTKPPQAVKELREGDALPAADSNTSKPQHKLNASIAEGPSNSRAAASFVTLRHRWEPGGTTLPQAEPKWSSGSQLQPNSIADTSKPWSGCRLDERSASMPSAGNIFVSPLQAHDRQRYAAQQHAHQQLQQHLQHQLQQHMEQQQRVQQQQQQQQHHPTSEAIVQHMGLSGFKHNSFADGSTVFSNASVSSLFSNASTASLVGKPGLYHSSSGTVLQQCLPASSQLTLLPQSSNISNSSSMYQYHPTSEFNMQLQTSRALSGACADMLDHSSVQSIAILNDTQPVDAATLNTAGSVHHSNHLLPAMAELQRGMSVAQPNAMVEANFPSSGNVAMQPASIDSKCSDILRAIQRNLHAASSIDHVIPSRTEGVLGLLYSVRGNTSRCGAAAWDGQQLHDLGSFGSLDDAKQACSGVLKLLEQLSPSLAAAMLVKQPQGSNPMQQLISNQLYSSSGGEVAAAVPLVKQEKRQIQCKSGSNDTAVDGPELKRRRSSNDTGEGGSSSKVHNGSSSPAFILTTMQAGSQQPGDKLEQHQQQQNQQNQQQQNQQGQQRSQQPLVLLNHPASAASDQNQMMQLLPVSLNKPGMQAVFSPPGLQAGQVQGQLVPEGLLLPPGMSAQAMHVPSGLIVQGGNNLMQQHAQLPAGIQLASLGSANLVLQNSPGIQSPEHPGYIFLVRP